MVLKTYKYVTIEREKKEFGGGRVCFRCIGAQGEFHIILWKKKEKTAVYVLYV